MQAQNDATRECQGVDKKRDKWKTSNERDLDLVKKHLGEQKSLQLVIGGSYYKEVGDDASGLFYNLAPLLIKDSDNKWTILDTYEKKIPFSTLNSYGLPDVDLCVEDIEPTESIMVIPCKDIIIGVAICRDVMDLTDKYNPIHKYCDFVDLMLVISYNDGDSNMFVGTAECLARWHNCATLYTNSVSATAKKSGSDDKLEVSFGIYPSKGKDKGSTSVSGEITYLKKPLVNSSDENNFTPVGILYSKDIKYVGLTDEDKKNCCKTYKMK